MLSNDGSCVCASLLNAIFCLAGRHSAPRAAKILEQDRTHYQNLKPLGLVVHRIENINVLKPNKVIRASINAGKSGKAFEILGSLKRGVWVVCLCQPGIVDHCITIDANRRRILDSVEKSSILLTGHSLRLCGGYRANNIHVAEVQEIVIIK